MTTEIKELAIVKRVMAVLKLDEKGKVEKFFRKEISRFTGEIRDINNYLTALENKYEADLDRLKDSIEDAKESVEAAYESITKEDVINNESMKSFSIRYWENINSAEAKVKSLEKQVEELKKVYDETIKIEKSKISKIEERVAIIIK